MTRNTKSTKKAGKQTLKVGKLSLNKETVKNLTGAESKKIKGGQLPEAPATYRCTRWCSYVSSCCD
jgi:hypothetical protein